MNKTQLSQTLEQLHAELEGTRSLDQETRENLRHIARDIQGLLDESSQPSVHRSKSINEMLRAALVELQVSHPNLALTVERVVDAFNEAGI
jgi:ABC-type transporter Mla subunit MlaD